MIEVPKKLISEVENLVAMYGFNKIEIADIMGQVIEQLPDSCMGVDTKWALGGMMYSLVVNSKAVQNIKNVVDYVGDKRFNYNDLDCDIWAKHFRDYYSCVDCDSFIASVMGKEIPDPCPRCKGSKTDPEFYREYWVVIRGDHGSAVAYIVEKNCSNETLHIRELPSNQTSEELEEIKEELCREIIKERFDTKNPYIRYQDSRDKGFVLTLEYDLPEDDPKHEKKIHHSCEANLRSEFYISMAIEHFPCVLKEKPTL